MGEILPTLRIKGNSPDSIHLLKIEQKTGDIMGEQCLNTIIGMSLNLSFLNSLIIDIISDGVVFSRKSDEAWLREIVPEVTSLRLLCVFVKIFC